ncbi:MAG: type II secretion system protein [Campylobacterota bacterium]|nr:type II secretion system protein [Campylobacterota bacterium]
MVRGGFTLVELLFAIVVIAISVMSLPMMTQTTSKAIDTNLVQEAIFAASAELNGAVTAHWDENSMQDDKNGLARVIDIDDRCVDKRLEGHIEQKLHRRCLESSDTDPLDSDSDDEIYALEDMAHDAQNIFDTDETNAQGYKKKYNSTVEITRPSSFNGDNKHIKEILLSVTDTDGATITILKTYSSNIGEVDYYKRRY